MDILKYLIGEAGEEDEGLLAGMVGQGVGHFRGLLVNGELSQIRGPHWLLDRLTCTIPGGMGRL